MLFLHPAPLGVGSVVACRPNVTGGRVPCHHFVVTMGPVPLYHARKMTSGPARDVTPYPSPCHILPLSHLGVSHFVCEFQKKLRIKTGSKFLMILAQTYFSGL